MNHSDITELLVHSLDDMKAESIKVLDVRQLCNFTDHMIIATARSPRHSAAIAEKVALAFKQQSGISPVTEGEKTGEWVLLDCKDAIVHIMVQEQRDRYALEKLWTTHEENALLASE